MASCSKSPDNSIETDQESLKIHEESRKRRRSCDDEILSINDVDCSVSSAPVSKKEKSTEAIACNPEHDGSDNDPPGLYGLKPEYLKMLGITPPLQKWVHVTNFRCDKSDLRDVMELAGHVVICSVVTIRERYAKVKYSHPLEAVQAISMLHNQKFYGQTLKIIMSHCATDTYILPKGLNDIGPGLGIGGKPVRDIVKEYEKFTEEKESLLNTSLFSKTGANLTIRDDENKVENVSIKTIDSWDDDWSVKDDNKDDQFHEFGDLANFSKKRRFTVRNVEESDDSNGLGSESGLKNKTNTKSPPLEAPGVSPPLTQVEKNSEHCNSQTLPKRSDSRGSSSTQSSLTLAPSRNLRPVVPQTSPGNPGLEPQNLPPGFNPGYGSIRPRPISSISAPNTPMIRPNGPGFVNNSVCPAPRLGGPLQGPNGIPAPNIPIIGPRPNMNPIGPIVPNGIGPNPRIPGPCPIVGPRPNFGGLMANGPMNAPMGLLPHTKTATLEFRNLPPSTTFAILCEKMSECGQVLSIQMTTPGCAIVEYIHMSHADRCFQRFNRTIIEGCLIEARFI